MKKIVKKMLLVGFQLLQLQLWSEAIVRIDTREETEGHRSMDELLEQTLPDDVSFTQAELFTLYDPATILSFFKSDENYMTKVDLTDNYLLAACSRHSVRVNGVKLTKGIVTRCTNDMYSGFCVYFNLSGSFQRKHTYINKRITYTVFDEKGTPYFLVCDLDNISLYPISAVNISGGGVYDIEPDHTYINYIDENTKQIMCYTVETQELVKLDIPVLQNPQMSWGYEIETPKEFDEKDLRKVENENLCFFNGGTYRVTIGEEVEEGIFNMLDTLYITDYTSDSRRKKGVYILRGPEFTYYPKL